MTPPDPWQGLLEPGERILWQGRPDAHPDWRMLSVQRTVLGAVFAIVALIWIVQASTLAGGGGLVTLIGLPFLGLGLYQLGGHVLWDAFRRARTWYTLTDRRAFIATDLPLRGKRLQSYPITRDTLLSFDDAPLASIGFAFAPVPLKRTTRLRMIGFERIADGRAVYALIRGVHGRDAPDRSAAET
jgi:hypothetical protein